MAVSNMGPGLPFVAAADLSAKQYYVVYLSAANTVNVSGAGVLSLGVLQNKPESGEGAIVSRDGDVTSAVAGAAISAGDELTTDSSGRVITADDYADEIIGIAMSAASAAAEVIEMLQIHKTKTSGLALTSAADLTAKQYLAVKITAASTVNLSGAGEVAIGILQNAPAAAAVAKVSIDGQVTSAISGAAVTVGTQVTPDAAGKLVTATTGDYVIGTAVTGAAAGDATFLVYQAHDGIAA